MQKLLTILLLFLLTSCSSVKEAHELEKSSNNSVDELAMKTVDFLTLVSDYYERLTRDDISKDSIYSSLNDNDYLTIFRIMNTLSAYYDKLNGDKDSITYKFYYLFDEIYIQLLYKIDLGFVGRTFYWEKYDIYYVDDRENKRYKLADE